MATGIIEVVIGKLAGAVVGKLGEMAVEHVANQASLLLHFKNDFEWLQSKLKYVRGYLQHEHNQNEAVKKWFADLQDIALDAEDIVEECAVHGDSLTFRRKMGKQIRKLKDRIESIMKTAGELNLVRQMCKPLTFLSSEEWKKSSLVEINARPVAIDAKVEQILHLLEDDAHQIIGVVGMGGIGKTFLLQNVYNHSKVRQRFEKAIWLSISQVYSVARLQYDIASHFSKDVEEGGLREQRVEELIKKVGEREQRVAELIKEGGLSEQQATELIKKVGVRKQRVELIKERGLSEQQAAEFIKEGGLCEIQAGELIDAVEKRKQLISELIKESGINEEHAANMIEFLITEISLIERIKEGGVTKEKSTKLIEMLQAQRKLIKNITKGNVSEQEAMELIKQEWVKVSTKKRRRSEKKAAKSITEDGLSKQQGTELIHMLRYESALIEGGLSEQQAVKAITDDGLSEQQVEELIQMLRDENSLIEWIKENGVTEQQAAKLIKEGILSKQQAAGLIQRLINENSLIALIKNGGVSEQRAAELIQKKIKNETTLIVLDDVWRVKGVNNLIERLGIPCGTSNPCKVVISTRNIDVCNDMGAFQIYDMKLLSQDDSWNLFCLHAFPDHQQNRPPEELVEVAHHVEKECGRLPLAIKTIAASMVTQKQLSSWKSKLHQLKEVSHLDDPIEPILRLSYDALSPELKPCFLYFSFFGENVEIDAEYLIYLWIGEGFIPGVKEQWNTGLSYLKQLNNLCLVQVREDWELKKTCKIHDFLLDLSISISREYKCAFTVEEASTVRCRRLLLAKKVLDEADISQLKCPKSLRTLSLSQNIVTELPIESLTAVGALRVIDLSYTNISLLPRCMENFKLLKVLNLSTTQFRKVPDCVRNLKSLWFLNVDTCLVPKWIGDLKCLQHLHVFRVDYSPEISGEISKLISLRTLRSQNEILLVLKDVAKLIHLQELRIHIAHESEFRSMEEGVLPIWLNMRHLTIILEFGFSRKIMFSEKMKEMKDLEYLRLWRFTVPRWICEYENLRVIKLRGCSWSECPALETMPNLLHLELIELQCKELRESFGKSGAFPQLRILVIKDYFGSEELPDLQHGAMSRVEVFMVCYCRRLKKIPEGFENLRSLKLLDLKGAFFTKKERERIQEGGEYWSTIKSKNPHVTISTTLSSVLN